MHLTIFEKYSKKRNPKILPRNKKSPRNPNLVMVVAFRKYILCMVNRKSGRFDTSISLVAPFVSGRGGGGGGGGTLSVTEEKQKKDWWECSSSWMSKGGRVGLGRV